MELDEILEDLVWICHQYPEHLNCMLPGRLISTFIRHVMSNLREFQGNNGGCGTSSSEIDNCSEETVMTPKTVLSQDSITASSIFEFSHEQFSTIMKDLLYITSNSASGAIFPTYKIISKYDEEKLLHHIEAIWNVLSKARHDTENTKNNSAVRVPFTKIRFLANILEANFTKNSTQEIEYIDSKVRDLLKIKYICDEV